MMPQAFTWNGFEDGTTWLGGLWAGKTTEQGDFATLVYRAQLYGFNAVRIPFRWAQNVLHGGYLLHSRQSLLRFRIAAAFTLLCVPIWVRPLPNRGQEPLHQ